MRSGLRQLADGLATLHDAGRIHRDLKPSNVLVTEAGRVVVLDFGLVAEVDQDYTEGTLHQNIAGSAAYMSPEQAVGHPLTPASDWYSVGVMLYEALTGSWPFTGQLYQILTAKQSQDPVPPKDLIPTVPDDLNDLCLALLRREPENRPLGREIIATFQGKRARQTDSNRTPRPMVRVAPRFQFREAELTALKDSLQAARWGRRVVTFVRGPAGVGKTALVREFLKRLKQSDESAFHLKGRCYEWENVPYKALDGILDNLSRVLRRLDHREVRAVATEDMAYLAAVFPVLSRIEAFETDADLDEDPQVIVDRAFRGLTRVFQFLAKKQPLVLFIDDAQWGDVASAQVLLFLLHHLGDVPFLLILGHQVEVPGEFLTALFRGLPKAHCEVRAIDVDPLNPEDATILAAQLLQTSRHAEMARTAALESGGIPGTIRDRARNALARSAGGDDPGDNTFNEVVVHSVQSLPKDARALLDTIAVSSRPLSIDVLVGAARIADPVQPLSTLRALQLIHTGLAGDTLEVGGEALKNWLLDHLSEERLVEIHYALASALELSETPDSEAIVSHYHGAGEHQKAGVMAWLAAKPALEQNQFQEAAWLLQRASEYGTWSAGERRSIQILLGQSMAMIGHGRKAAQAFASAASDAPPEKQLQYRQQGAEQVLFSGHFDEAVPLLDQLLVELGQSRIPGTTMARQLSRMRRLQLWWRGADFTERTEVLCSDAELLQVDVLWIAALGLGYMDPAVGAAMQALHLGTALDVGEPKRVARALAVDLPFRVLSGRDDWPQMFQKCLELSAKGGKETRARVLVPAATAHLWTGQWAKAAQLATEADQLHEARGNAFAWERFLAQVVKMRAELMLGRMRDVVDVLGPMQRRLQDSQNQLALVATAGITAWIRLAENDPRKATEDLDQVGDTGMGFRTLHVELAVARAMIEQYQGQRARAWELIDAVFKPATAFFGELDRVVEAELLWARGRAGLGIGRDGMAAGIKEADRVAGLLRKLAPWCAPFADLLGAGVKSLSKADGAPLAAEARKGFEKGGMPLLAQIAEWRRAQLAKDDAGLKRAHEALVELGIVDPERFVTTVAPS